MKLEHIAITITHLEDIQNFYIDILGMNNTRNFILSSELALRIFNIKKEVNVFLLQSDEFYFELFLTDKQTQVNCNHLCLSFTNLEIILNKAKKRHYEIIQIQRNSTHDLIFLKDQSGNLFELKNSKQ